MYLRRTAVIIPLLYCLTWAWSLAGNETYLAMFYRSVKVSVELDDGEFRLGYYSPTTAASKLTYDLTYGESDALIDSDRPGVLRRMAGSWWWSGGRRFDVRFPGWLFLLLFSTPVILPEWRRWRGRRGFPVLGQDDRAGLTPESPAVGPHSK